MKSSESTPDRRTSDTTSLEEVQPVPEVTQDHDEKGSTIRPDEDGEQYEYLTFETILPAYATSPQNSGGHNTAEPQEICFAFQLVVFTQDYHPHTVMLYHISCWLHCRIILDSFGAAA